MHGPQTPLSNKRVLLHSHTAASLTLPSPAKLSPQTNKLTQCEEQMVKDAPLCALLTPLQSQTPATSTPESPLRIPRKRKSINVNVNSLGSVFGDQTPSREVRIITPPLQITSATPELSDLTPVQRHPMTLITVSELQKIKRVRLSNPFLEDPFKLKGETSLPHTSSSTTHDNTHLEFVNGTTGKKSTVRLSQRQLDIKPKRLDFSQVQFAYGF